MRGAEGGLYGQRSDAAKQSKAECKIDQDESVLPCLDPLNYK